MNKLSKTELKHIAVGSVKILAFVLVFMILLQLLSNTYFSQKGATHYKTALNKAYAFLQEPDNSIDVVAIGNSDLYSAFVPAELWTKHGYTCTVIASPHQTPLQSYKMLQTLFEKQHPRVVVIETDMLYDEMVEKNGSVKGEQNIVQFLFDNYDTEDFEEIVQSQFPIFTFHDKWKKAGKPKKVDTPDSHGYKYSSTVRRVTIGDYMKETEDKEPIKSKNAEMLRKIQELCEENGSEVFFIEMPSVTSWNTERHNAVEELTTELGADFLDLNLLPRDMGLNLEVSFRDKGNHLNYDAACKVTDYLGDYIAAHYHLDDRRDDPDYAFYQTSIERFYNQIEAENAAKGEIQ